MMRLIAIVATGSCLVGVAHAQPDKVLYELQERCGKRAAEIFEKEWDGHILKDKDGVTTADYENHYSPRLNKCFYLQKVSSFSGGVRTMELYDLNENKQLGSFASGSVGISDCQLQGKYCRSEQEWRELTKPFLEE